mgnify:CR=1 FL=1
MTFIVDENCIKCKITDCVNVCPVDCFYEGENMLVIDPDGCIDCGACVPECPVEAIHQDDDENVENMEKWLEINEKYSKIWPLITKVKDPMPDDEKYRNEKNKFEKYFSDKPGEGNLGEDYIKT